MRLFQSYVSFRQLRTCRRMSLCRRSATSGCELSQQICPLLDQFVKRGRQLEADCLGGLEIDDQFDVLACNALTHQDAILCSLSDVPIAAITVHFGTGHDTAAMGGLGVAQRFL